MNNKVYAIDTTTFTAKEFFGELFPGSTWDDASESFTMPDGRVFDTFTLEIDNGGRFLRDIQFRKIVQFIQPLVTITKREYLELQKQSLKLSYLERGGVDNWEWYGESLDNEYDDTLEELDMELKKIPKITK